MEPQFFNRAAEYNSGFSFVESGSCNSHSIDMDPLSVGASVIAVVGATGKIVRGIRRLKAMQDAPKELDDLLTEVSQFELVIKASQKINGHIESELGTLLKIAQDLVTEFESLIEYKLTEPGTSNKVDRWQWLRSSKDVERLRVKLRDVTANLVALVGVTTSLSMDQISQNTNQILSENRHSSNQMLSAFAHLFQLLEESPSTRAALNGSLGNFRQLTLEGASEANGTGTLIPRSKTLQSDGIVSTNVFRVSKAQKVTICTANCPCKCHHFRGIGSPGVLSNILGHGYVETAGSFFCKSQCDTLICKAQAGSRVSIQYRLPQWLASRMIVMWLTSCPPCPPEILLRVPRVVDSGTAAFKAADAQDLESFKLAIAKGDSKPYDVNEYGQTIFSWLVTYVHCDMLFHLSNYPEYWNPSLIDSSTESEIWKLLVLWRWTMYITSQLRQHLMTKLSHLIDFDDYIEKQKFTRTHQIVCGLSTISLNVELQDSNDIDTLDSEGRSALWYAVTHRRHKYVCKLLETGADPNVGDLPIWKALEFDSDYAIIRALLDYGANFGSFKDSFSIVQWAYVCGPDVLAIDELLVKYGLDPNHRGDYGETILHLARFFDDDIGSRRLKQLIELGSDIEIADEVGMTAIMHAVYCSSAPAFGVLASAGARVDLKSAKGDTILHLAVAPEFTFCAENVPELCEMFRDADLTELDLKAEDQDGNRAFDLLRIRNGPNWEDYYVHHGMGWYPFDAGPEPKRRLEAELEAISALEKLLHHVQEVQGVPEADRYPPLGEYCSRIIEEEPVPGAWPMY